MQFTRRRVLQLLGGSAGAAALAGVQFSRAQHTAENFERWATPEETVAPSICQQCPGGCGLLVRTHDGEVTGIAGNPLHPVNRGAVCPKAFGGLELLYDGNRIKQPLARAGERGKFRPIGWDEAIAMVSRRLSELRTKGLSHTVAILGGQYRGYRDTLWKRFAEAYGTPNYIRLRCIAPEKPALAHQLMQGVTSPLRYDLAQAQFILSFGAGLLEAWLGPVHASRAFAQLRRSPEHGRGRFIQVDPRRSVTAIKADRWVPVVPGSDGVLALGIANVMIREGLYDQEFITEHAFGFEDWTDSAGRQHTGFKNLVLRDYGLFTVSAVTGVPVKAILEIARNLGTLKPAIVIGERGSAYGPDDLHIRMAIHSLNALAGNIGVPGGLSLQADLPLAPLPPVIGDGPSQRGAGRPRIDGAGESPYAMISDAPQVLPDRILKNQPYPVSTLFLFTTNPLVNNPAKEAFGSALKNIPFIVSFSPFFDESTAAADLVLPDDTYLERWQDDPVTHLAGFSSFSVARPASKALHQTRNTADVLLRLAHDLGGSVAQSFPWKKFEDVLHEASQGLYKSGRGYIASVHTEEALRSVLERQGFWIPEFPNADAFWNALLERGAWWDPTGLPVGRKAMLKTASGKFEFYSTALKESTDRRRAGNKSNISVGRAAAGESDDLSFLPAVSIPRAVQPQSLPLRLNSYRLMTRPMGGGKNQPWLLEQAAVHVNGSWESWVEVHPETAAALGIKNDDWVWVESAKGRIKLRARLYPWTRPDVIHIPLFGGEGPNPNDLIENETDTSRGLGLFNTTAVRLRRA